VSNFIRYDTPDGEGQTRRERNQSFGMSHHSKDVNITFEARYLWDIFWQICNRHNQDDRGPLPMLAGDFFNEIHLSGNLINRKEADILLAMDAAYCTSLREEIRSNTIRAAEKTRNK